MVDDIVGAEFLVRSRRAVVFDVEDDEGGRDDGADLPWAQAAVVFWLLVGISGALGLVRV